MLLFRSFEVRYIFLYFVCLFAVSSQHVVPSVHYTIGCPLCLFDGASAHSSSKCLQLCYTFQCLDCMFDGALQVFSSNCTLFSISTHVCVFGPASDRTGFRQRVSFEPPLPLDVTKTMANTPTWMEDTCKVCFFPLKDAPLLTVSNPSFYFMEAPFMRQIGPFS